MVERVPSPGHTRASSSPPHSPLSRDLIYPDQLFIPAFYNHLPRDYCNLSFPTRDNVLNIVSEISEESMPGTCTTIEGSHFHVEINRKLIV